MPRTGVLVVFAYGDTRGTGKEGPLPFCNIFHILSQMPFSLFRRMGEFLKIYRCKSIFNWLSQGLKASSPASDSISKMLIEGMAQGMHSIKSNSFYFYSTTFSQLFTPSAYTVNFFLFVSLNSALL